MKKVDAKKRRNSNDRLDANPKEDMDQPWERQEAEKRMQELKEERAARFDIINRRAGKVQDQVRDLQFYTTDGSKGGPIIMLQVYIIYYIT